MNTRKRSPLAFLLPTLCLALATPALADDTDEGQDPPRTTEGAMATSAGEAVVLDLATGAVNLLLQVTLL